MKTLNLEEAADFLRMTPEGLRRKAKRGEVPGRNTGRAWLFVEEYLAEWVGGRDFGHTVEPETATPLKPLTCLSGSVTKPGTSSSLHRTGNEYNALLERLTNVKRRNSMTN